MSEVLVQKSESGLLDTIGKFCMDLILGDFEENPSNAAMVVNGLVQLIPIAGQVLAARDVCGMIFRISRIGPAKCGKNEWMELAIAAFGCIPEVGALFKTIVKPLWRGSAALKGSVRGQAFISAMLGKSKGAAITFIKTFNWAGHTQAAIQQVDQGLTLCDQFLAYLEQEHWWEPAALQGLAHDMRPQLKGLSGPLRTGLREGTEALREFLITLLGEDGYAVAQAAAAAATTSSGGGRGGAAAPASHARTAPATSRAKKSAKPAEEQKKSHDHTAETNRQNAEPGGGPKTIARRITRAAWAEIGSRYKGLLGEHMAHYHHMKLHAPGSWPHGTVKDQHPNARWTGEKKLVTEQGKEATPTELVPEHLVRINQSGVDGVWALGNKTYHFVEAKANESAGAMFGQGASDWKELAKEEPPASTEAKPKGKGAKGKSTTPRQPKKLRPPPGMTERQVALWCMLSQPKKGLQMSRPWARGSVKLSMWSGNEANRWVYVYFAISGSSPPRDYTPAAGGPLKKEMAPGMPEHAAASLEVARRAVAGGDLYDLALHDQHKADHTPSDVFTVEEIDEVAERYDNQVKALAAKPPASTPQTQQPKPQSTPSTSRQRKKK
ncbi:hypothetical protein [Variovorax sp. 38R]|uniref:hypothetical protein n=1 Tax=Variovorax sp. 38R TaxID=2774875 RepID=UPI00177F1BE3|nr:hypothetical protein [Variovorax sp. 38R]QOF78329.1 hypothetical protein IG196_29230 [Variovorax sp. 38R]